MLGNSLAKSATISTEDQISPPEVVVILYNFLQKYKTCHIGISKQATLYSSICVLH